MSTPIIVKLGFIPKQSCDMIEDSVMEELIRRFTFTSTIGDGFGLPIYSATAPDDKSRPWVVTNSSGLPTGSVRVWDSAVNKWVESVKEEDEEPREMVTQRKSLSITANGSYVAQWDDDFETDDYQVSVVATSPQGNGKFHKTNQTVGTASVVVETYNLAFTIEVTGTGFLKKKD